jgi:glycosyltransferase involved in cell wall biosynthesis
MLSLSSLFVKNCDSDKSPQYFNSVWYKLEFSIFLEYNDLHGTVFDVFKGIELMLSVLLAAYNGEKYLPEQLESIFEQSHKEFKLYVCDDCSNDKTSNILQAYSRRFSESMIVKTNIQNTGSAKNNFFSMISHVKDDYIMLSDQDDVWLPDKIEKTLAKMQELEVIHGCDTPLLVHTDLMVVDDSLRIINPSFNRSINIDCNKTGLNRAVVQNTLTGCTCMYNRALAELITEKLPEHMIMHDWWLMLVANAFGHVGYLNEATILYRQHGDNVVGAKNVHSVQYQIERLMDRNGIKKSLSDTYRQAENFLYYYCGRLALNQKELLEQYCGIQTKSKMAKLNTLFHLKTFKHGLSRNIAHLLFV